MDSLHSKHNIFLDETVTRKIQLNGHSVNKGHILFDAQLLIQKIHATHYL